MSRWKVAIVAAVIMVSIVVMADSCNGSPSGIQGKQQQQNEQTATKLCASVGGCNPNLTYSTELANQKRFYQVMNSPSLIGYVYLMSQTGGLVFEYQVRGKCSSTESQLTTPSSINSDVGNGAGGADPVVIPAPQPDGSYGQNENGIFCFLNNAGHSIIEFNAASWYWIWSQERITFPTPAIISIVPNGH